MTCQKKMNTSTIHQTANKDKFDLILTDLAQISDARQKTKPWITKQGQLTLQSLTVNYWL
jgi:hypothetical protein